MFTMSDIIKMIFPITSASVHLAFFFPAILIATLMHFMSWPSTYSALLLPLFLGLATYVAKADMAVGIYFSCFVLSVSGTALSVADELNVSVWWVLIGLIMQAGFLWQRTLKSWCAFWVAPCLLGLIFHGPLSLVSVPAYVFIGFNAEWCFYHYGKKTIDVPDWKAYVMDELWKLDWSLDLSIPFAFCCHWLGRLITWTTTMTLSLLSRAWNKFYDRFIAGTTIDLGWESKRAVYDEAVRKEAERMERYRRLDEEHKRELELAHRQQEFEDKLRQQRELEKIVRRAVTPTVQSQRFPRCDMPTTPYKASREDATSGGRAGRQIRQRKARSDAPVLRPSFGFPWAVRPLPPRYVVPLPSLSLRRAEPLPQPVQQPPVETPVQVPVETPVQVPVETPAMAVPQYAPLPQQQVAFVPPAPVNGSIVNDGMAGLAPTMTVEALPEPRLEVVVPIKEAAYPIEHLYTSNHPTCAPTVPAPSQSIRMLNLDGTPVIRTPEGSPEPEPMRLDDESEDVDMDRHEESEPEPEPETVFLAIQMEQSMNQAQMAPLQPVSIEVEMDQPANQLQAAPLEPVSVEVKMEQPASQVQTASMGYAPSNTEIEQLINQVQMASLEHPLPAWSSPFSSPVVPVHQAPPNPVTPGPVHQTLPNPVTPPHLKTRSRSSSLSTVADHVASVELDPPLSPLHAPFVPVVDWDDPDTPPVSPGAPGPPSTPGSNDPWYGRSPAPSPPQLPPSAVAGPSHPPPPPPSFDEPPHMPPPNLVEDWVEDRVAQLMASGMFEDEAREIAQIELDLADLSE